MRVALQALVDEFKAREGEGPYESYYMLLISPGGKVQDSALRIDLAPLGNEADDYTRADLINMAREVIAHALVADAAHHEGDVMRVALQALVDEFKARELLAYDSYDFILIGPGGKVQEHQLRFDHMLAQTHAQDDLTEAAQILIRRTLQR